MAKLVKGVNDLVTLRPDMASEWHPTKNGNLEPSDVTLGSGKKVWWLGKCGHEWQTTVNSRISGNTGCPICANQVILPGFNDLQTKFPELAKMWHPIKNGELKPNEIAPYSRKVFWWKCENGHEWQRSCINSIDCGKSFGCPICSGKQILSGYNDLKTKFPEIADEWNYVKNGTMLPDMMSCGTHTKVWWKCKYDHEWKMTIANRTYGGQNCPICTKRSQVSFPEKAVYYYVKLVCSDAVESDMHLGKELDIFVPSKSIAIEYDGFNWHTNAVADVRKNQLCKDNNIQLVRIRESGLPLFDDCICIVRENHKSETDLDICIKSVLKILCPNISVDVNVHRDASLIQELYLQITQHSSFGDKYPEIAKEWHPTKNGNLTPFMVNIGSDKPVWWQCDKGHEWQTDVNHRIHGTGCPYCSGRSVIRGQNDLCTLNPELAQEWNYGKNGDLQPYDVKVNSSKKVWWRCDKGHEWYASVANRNKGKGCPYCSNRKLLSGYNDLMTVNPILAREWNYEKNKGLLDKNGNDISIPDNVLCGSHEKVWWRCSKCGYEWNARINSRGRMNGRGCPVCGREVVRHSQCRKVLCVETGVIYESTVAAAASVNMSSSNISICCRGKTETAGDYHWKYVDEEK